MPKPRRRRRFFALEGRFEVEGAGAPQGIAGSAQDDPLDTSTPSDEVETDPGEDDPRLPVDAEESDVPAAATENDALPPAFRLNRKPRDRSAQRRPLSRWTLLLSLLCLGVGVLMGYLFAKPVQKPVGTEASGGTPKGANVLTPADETDLDAAYTARHAHQSAEAEHAFNALLHRHPEWGPVEVEIGRTLFYQGKYHDGTVVLKAAVEKGWKPAEANFLLGVLNKTRKLYSEAEASFARAVALDPTQPEYYFFWGECLREEGKLLEATAKFRSALLRNQYETATGLYRAKLWLCAVETDPEAAADVNAQIDEALRLPRPPMEAFIAAAARDVRIDDLDAAMANLSRTRRRADETVFRYLISDTLFVPLRSKPEFAGFFGSATPAASPEPEAAATPAPASSPAKGKKP